MEDGTDRRGFFSLIIKGSAAIIGAITIIPGVGLLLAPVLNPPKRVTRRVLFAKPDDAKSTTFVAARLEGAPETDPGVFVKRGADGKPVVLYSMCTHAACTVTWKSADNKFFCPCHQGHFDGEGKNVGGPPTRPLARLEVTEKNGELFVKEPEV